MVSIGHNTRIVINHLEKAFSDITEALDKIGDLDLNFESQYDLEDIQNDIQNTIETLKG
jgi:hypothetical protein